MNNHKLFSILRIAFGLLIIAAIVTQLLDGISHGRSIINFLSFFTIESNILAAIILLAIGIYQLSGKSGRSIALLRGAMTLYMTITGIVYITLLSGNEQSLQTTIPWVNAVLHYIMPVVVLADWLLIPPKIHTPFKRALLWLVFPVAYVAYSLIRGALVQWYPYPFIDPVTNGWPNVVATCIFIFAGSMLITWLLTLRTIRNKPQRAM